MTLLARLHAQAAGVLLALMLLAGCGDTADSGRDAGGGHDAAAESGPVNASGDAATDDGSCIAVIDTSACCPEAHAVTWAAFDADPA